MSCPIPDYFLSYLILSVLGPVHYLEKAKYTISKRAKPCSCRQFTEHELQQDSIHYVWISPLELHMHVSYASRKIVI